MNTYIKQVLFCIAILTLGIISSCNRLCDAGYEGNHCITEVRSKYLGGFNGSLTCTTGNNTDSITISAVTTDVTKVIFHNLDNAGINPTGNVQDDGSVAVLNGNTVIGYAKIVLGKINIIYTVNDTVNCTWVQN